MVHWKKLKSLIILNIKNIIHEKKKTIALTFQKYKGFQIDPLLSKHGWIKGKNFAETWKWIMLKFPIGKKTSLFCGKF